jgi:Flp pilus assembly protein TadB
MAKPQISTRVDNELKKQINEYAEENNTSKAETMRILLRDGLEHQDSEQMREDVREVRKAIADGGFPEEVSQIQTEMEGLQQEVDSLKLNQTALLLIAVAATLVASFTVSSLIGAGVVLLFTALLFYFIFTVPVSLSTLFRGDG